MESQYITLLKSTCLDAGKAILTIYDSAEFGVELKSNNSPLTLADKAGHDAIMKHLTQTEYPVLSEEGKDIPFDERKNWKRFWMVDPLDGTKEFIKRNGEFTVNIALIEAGRPILGAVYVPVTDELFIGGEQMPAFKEQNGNRVSLSSSKSMSFHERIKQKNIRVVASRSHLNPETQEFLDHLIDPELVSMGSSLKFLALADQKADIYPRFAPTMEWDTAAAHAIMSSLAYHVENQEGNELQYNKKNLLNPYFICY